jgi:hypothetical protein
MRMSEAEAKLTPALLQAASAIERALAGAANDDGEYELPKAMRG